MSAGINHPTQLQADSSPRDGAQGDLCQVKRAELTEGIHSGDGGINQKALLRGNRMVLMTHVQAQE